MVDLSIVIPSYNRRDSICALVTALISQAGPGVAAEIVVVLDGSTDGSAEALACLATPPETRLCVHNQANQGRASARNTGIERATGEVVLFLDDDVVPKNGLVSAHLRAHRTADVILGRIDHLDAQDTPRVICEQEVIFYNERHALLSGGNPIRATDVFAGNLSVKRSHLHAVGGFDEAFTGYGCEDWDLGERLLQTGVVFAYASDAAVYHKSPVTAKRWRLNAWQEGRSQLTFVDKHPALTGMLDIGDLHEATWPARLAAQFAIQVPRLGMAASAATFRLARLVRPIVKPAIAQRIAFQSWRLAFWSGVRTAVGNSGDTRARCRFCAPILCYHRVCDDPNPELTDWAVRSDRFRRQMQLLRRLGYRVMTLQTLVELFEAGRPLDKVVVITFDDGYLDTVTTAAPILEEFGFPATVFVVTGCVGKTAIWDEEYGGEMAPLATWEQLRTLRDRGWEIGYHTITHPNLKTLAEEDAIREIVDGRSELERQIGSPATSLAYPFGEFTPGIARIAQESGLCCAVTLGQHLATVTGFRHGLRRIAIMRSDSLLDVRLSLSTGFGVRGLAAFALTSPVRVWRACRRPAVQW
jgi:GT2 family glycosyltransferase/peptidoglycan/xylan/chitin deacetylase (PgdA/CDA1 family)